MHKHHLRYNVFVTICAIRIHGHTLLKSPFKCINTTCMLTSTRLFLLAPDELRPVDLRDFFSDLGSGGGGGGGG